jgi:hypothetical protein
MVKRFVAIGYAVSICLGLTALPHNTLLMLIAVAAIGVGWYYIERI